MNREDEAILEAILIAKHLINQEQAFEIMDEILSKFELKPKVVNPDKRAIICVHSYPADQPGILNWCVLDRGSSDQLGEFETKKEAIQFCKDSGLWCKELEVEGES